MRLAPVLASFLLAGLFPSAGPAPARTPAQAASIPQPASMPQPASGGQPTSRTQSASSAQPASAGKAPAAAQPASSAQPTSGAQAATVAQPAPGARPVTSAQAAWSDAHPKVRAAVKAGQPLVVQVVVPLCSNDQVDCGSKPAGRPGDLTTNLYWGAMFGAKRFFDRKNSGWTAVSVSKPGGGVLEQAVYRRHVPGAAWGAQGAVEQLVVLQAVHGTSIDAAVDSFFALATKGGTVTFDDGNQQRTVRVSAAGYAGHNRLMDGKTLPAVSRPAAPLPSFVLACRSEGYFGAALRKAGSDTLVMTRDLMAPEGYVIEAVARALGDNAAPAEVRRQAVLATARYQKLPEKTAAKIFAKR